MTAREQKARKREAVKAARRKEAAQLWRGGMSMRQVARQMGVSVSTVSWWLYSYDNSYRAKLERERVPAWYGRMAKAAELYLQGKSLREIGAELGVSHQTAANDLIRWGSNDPRIVAYRQNLSRDLGVIERANGTTDFDAEIIWLTDRRTS